MALTLRSLAVKCVLVAGTLAVATPMSAKACTPLRVTVIEPEKPIDRRSGCRKIWRDREQILVGLQNGSEDYYKYRSIIQSMAEGKHGCGKRRDFAFQMADTAVGSPVRSGLIIDSYYPVETALNDFRNWAPDTLSKPRRDEVEIGAWMLSENFHAGFCGSGFYIDRLPRGFEEDAVRAVLLTEPYWEKSVAQFGNNPARDRLILSELMAPRSPYFDLQKAAELVPQFYGRDTIRGPRPRLRPIDIEVAEAITSGAAEKPDYEAAAGLLKDYSPYVTDQLSETELERVRKLWVRISQHRLASDDTELRKHALSFLKWGELDVITGKPIAQTLPEGAQIEVLGHWPDGLEPVGNIERILPLLADNGSFYRALGSRRGGRVELGVIFRPDGSYHDLHVTRDTGFEHPRLPSKQMSFGTHAKKLASRYFRPHLNKMQLTGFEGRYAYVPLPSFEFRVVGDRPKSTAEFVDGTIVISGVPYRGN